MSEVIIGVDLGGTQIRVARLDENLQILQREKTLTKDEEGLDATLNRIKELIHKVLPDDDTKVAGIGVSAPGPLNPETGVIVRPPNLKGWVDVPLADILNEEFNVPVFVGNDANVAALAETVLGAARGYRHVIYITVSTGIGSGIIIDGHLLLGKAGLAAEAGHVPIVVDDGVVSSLEKEAAGTALAQKARIMLENGTESIMYDMVEGDFDKVDAVIINEAAKQGDALALGIVERAGFIIGLGVTALLHLFNPEIIVIGGGVSKIGDLLFDTIHETVQEHALDEEYWKNLKIVSAELGGNVSVIGAATLVITKGGHEDVQSIANRFSDG